MKRALPLDRRGKPHLFRMGGLWLCFTNYGHFMARVGRGLTPGGAYDYWNDRPTVVRKRDMHHAIGLTARSY